MAKYQKIFVRDKFTMCLIVNLILLRNFIPFRRRNRVLSK